MPLRPPGVGDTPLIRSSLSKLFRWAAIDLKLESANPTGSVLDRGAWRCVQAARSAGGRVLVGTDLALAPSLEASAAAGGIECVFLAACGDGPGENAAGQTGAAWLLPVACGRHDLEATLRSTPLPRGVVRVERRSACWGDGFREVGLEIAAATADLAPAAVVAPSPWVGELDQVRAGLADWIWTAPGRGARDLRLVVAARASRGGLADDGVTLAVDGRDVDAALELAEAEDGLTLSRQAGEVFAAAIKAARSLDRRRFGRVVGVIEGEQRPGSLRMAAPGPVRPEEVAALLAALAERSLV